MLSLNPLKAMVPFVRQHLTQEKALDIFRESVASFEVPEGTHTMALLSEKDNKVYLTIVSVDAKNHIVKMHKQFNLVDKIITEIDKAL